VCTASQLSSIECDRCTKILTHCTVVSAGNVLPWMGKAHSPAVASALFARSRFCSSACFAGRHAGCQSASLFHWQAARLALLLGRRAVRHQLLQSADDLHDVMQQS
jgi:hypothetical protein